MRKELSNEELEALPVGSRVAGISVATRKRMVATRRELYDGALTWDVEGFGTYRTRSLLEAGFNWHIEADDK